MGCLSDLGMPKKKDRDKIVRKEAQRTDVKLIENAENIPGIKLAKLKPANKKNGHFQIKNLLVWIKEKKFN